MACERGARRVTNRPSRPPTGWEGRSIFVLRAGRWAMPAPINDRTTGIAYASSYPAYVRIRYDSGIPGSAGMMNGTARRSGGYSPEMKG